MQLSTVSRTSEVAAEITTDQTESKRYRFLPVKPWGLLFLTENFKIVLYNPQAE